MSKTPVTDVVRRIIREEIEAYLNEQLGRKEVGTDKEGVTTHQLTKDGEQVGYAKTKQVKGGTAAAGRIGKQVAGKKLSEAKKKKDTRSPEEKARDLDQQEMFPDEDDDRKEKAKAELRKAAKKMKQTGLK